MKKCIATLILSVPLLFISPGCEVAEVLLGNNIFNLKYAQLDGNVPLAQIKLWAEGSGINPLDSASDSFFPVEDPTNDMNISRDRMELFGDADTPQGLIEIHMNRGAGPDDHMNRIYIQLNGPFIEGQEMTSGTVEVTLGGPLNTSDAICYDYDNTPDTYFSFTITNLNTVAKTIGGNFHMVVTKVDDRTAEPISIYEGAFSWNLD